jgi:hypothetical protein
MTQTDTAADTSLDAGMRRWGTVLMLWRLCGNASCRRAHACRGRPRLCGPANYPLLPDGVRGWFEMLAEAKEEGLSFEEARAWLEGSEEEQAFRDWSAAVEGSLR